MKLRFLPRARADIVEIHQYIAQHNSRAARTVVRRIRATARLLARHPNVGRPTNIGHIRVLPIVRYPYLVYCIVTVDELVVVHIRHGSRAAPTAEDL